MLPLSDEEFKNISQMFVFSGFCVGAVNCNEQAGEFYETLKRVGQTGVGANLLRQIYDYDNNISIRLDFDWNSDSEFLGYCRPHYFEDASLKYQEITTKHPGDKNYDFIIVHELTHALQHRVSGDGGLLQNPERKFMYDRFCEAEARLNTAKFVDEVLTKMYEKGDLTGTNVLKEAIGYQTRKDYMKYRTLKNEGHKKNEINKMMIDYIYSDRDWREIYHEQNVKHANNYIEATDISNWDRYMNGRIGKDLSTIISVFGYRLRISTEDIRKYICETHSDYNPQEIKPRTKGR